MNAAVAYLYIPNLLILNRLIKWRWKKQIIELYGMIMNTHTHELWPMIQRGNTESSIEVSTDPSCLPSEPPTTPRRQWSGPDRRQQAKWRVLADLIKLATLDNPILFCLFKYRISDRQNDRHGQKHHQVDRERKRPSERRERPALRANRTTWREIRDHDENASIPAGGNSKPRARK